MNKATADQWLQLNRRYLPAKSMPVLRKMLCNADARGETMLQTIRFFKPTSAVICSIFFGMLGIDRFLIGDTGMGVLKFLTGGLCGVLYIADWFLIGGEAKEKNYLTVMNALK